MKADSLEEMKEHQPELDMILRVRQLDELRQWVLGWGRVNRVGALIITEIDFVRNPEKLQNATDITLSVALFYYRVCKHRGV